MASIAMDISDDYIGEEEEDDSHEYIHPEDFVAVVLLLDLTGYRLADQIEQDATAITADIIPTVGVVGASDDSELAAAVAEALETVEAPSDDGHGCSICLEDDDDTAVWKETPCGHRFHGRCVERWLHAKGSCPMCRRQVVTMPAADDTNTDAYLQLVRTVWSIFEAHNQDGVSSTFMEEQ